jgi:chitinase
MLPLVTEKNIALTHLVVCSFHVNFNGEIHLNDYPPYFPLFNTVWAEVQVLKDTGVKIMGMVGGAAPGSFSSQTLDGDETSFEYYYGQLRDVIKRFGLEGMDIDVEQAMSQNGISRLVDRLFEDFGPDFIITLAPVASALRGGANLSGFDYALLEKAAAPAIDFYNAQFYNGFGSMATTAAYDAVIAKGWFPSKILVGQITTPANGGQFVPFDKLNATIRSLQSSYGQIGGVMGWEYFNSAPGNTSKPWEWAQAMTEILRPGSPVRLSISKEKAEYLVHEWRSSVAGIAGADALVPTVDYMSMVNA